MPTSQYDHHFRIYANIYFAETVSWQWFKAQAIVESAMNPLAVSPKGAAGLMQLMPGTSAMVAKEMWVDDTPLNPRVNILMGIHYDRKMWRIFKREEGLERLCFMFGAYNAGAGNIIKAQGHARHPDRWRDVAAVLRKFTGRKNAGQTIQYVDRILDARQKMIGENC